jgi:hypothetical protein
MGKASNRVVLLISAVLMCSTAMAKGDKGPQGSEALPPGLQKKMERGGRLPPGWQKKLNRGEVLEAELYRLGEPVSAQLRLRLPLGPHGSVELRLENKIVRIDRESRVILDVFDIR